MVEWTTQRYIFVMQSVINVLIVGRGELNSEI